MHHMCILLMRFMQFVALSFKHNVIAVQNEKAGAVPIIGWWTLHCVLCMQNRHDRRDVNWPLENYESWIRRLWELPTSSLAAVTPGAFCSAQRSHMQTKLTQYMQRACTALYIWSKINLTWPIVDFNTLLRDSSYHFNPVSTSKTLKAKKDRFF